MYVQAARVSTLTHLGKMFGMSVGWLGGWAKSYVQVEYANTKILHLFFFS